MGTIPEPYKKIVEKNISVLDSGINDNTLSEYFENCFNDLMIELSIYQCWACVGCLENGNSTTGFGDKPNNCPTCNSNKIYQIATFNKRASKAGDMFEWAFYHLMKEKFNLPIVHTPPAFETHDFEISGDVGVETKGSPDHIINPDGSRSNLGVPGMIRSDTKKKAFANGKAFRQKNKNKKFYIITNAMDDKLIDYSDRDIDGIYDVTKVEQLNKFVMEVKSNKS